MISDNGVIRHGKEVFTTSIAPETLETFKVHCWENNQKINETIEGLITEYLRMKVDKCD